MHAYEQKRRAFEIALSRLPKSENALIEESVRLKERVGGKVTAITMGPPQAEAVLREAIAGVGIAGVAAIGYGDGYPRHLPSGTPLLVNGRQASLAGRVSMDMVTIDLRTTPAAAVGDTVTLWGRGLPVDDIAARAGTIAYELLCGISARVPRVYRD